MDAEDALPKVTAAMLRGSPTACRRRLAHLWRDTRGQASGTARFQVTNRVVADARLAQAGLGPPQPRAFVAPADLLPEQQRCYSAAVAGYLTLFGDAPGRAVELPFESELTDVGIRIVGDPGLAVEGPDGARELRLLRIGGRTGLDDTDVYLAALRAATWAAGPLHLVAADLLALTFDERTFDTAAAGPDARAWLTDRLALLRDAVADARPRTGTECGSCAFVAGCPPHRDA